MSIVIPGSVKGKIYLERYLFKNGISGLESLSKDIEDIFMKLSIFYADDTVILSDAPSDLQHALNEFFVVKHGSVD